MTLDEKRWQKKLATKRKAQGNRKPLRRRTETHSAAQAAHLPIHDCLMPNDLFETGVGMVVLARALPSGELALATFLVDVYCLGVKDAFYYVVTPEQWVQFVQRFNLEKIHPSCLRKLVEGAVDYARALGFAPHPDYAGAARLFGSIDAAACPVRYTYGKDGKPLYLSRPEDSPAQSRHILNTLTRRLGPKGFHFLTAIDDLADELGREAPEPVRVVSYEITEEPLPDATFEQLPSDVQAQINALHDEVLKARPRKALAALRTLVTQYPDVAQIYNYLYVACYNLGERAEAARVVQETVQRFPDYLFGHISLAEECLQRGEPEKIAEIFRGKLDLKLLYPGRARFHLSEVLSFNSVVARYYHALGDREQAERSYELMRQLRPNHPSTRLVGRTLHGSRFRVWLREKLKLPGH